MILLSKASKKPRRNSDVGRALLSVAFDFDFDFDLDFVLDLDWILS